MPQESKFQKKKKISLDYGSNLSKFEVYLKGTDTISAGLTLHEKLGEIGVNEKNGWISYWEPHFDTELGLGIVIPCEAMTTYQNYITNKKDESNLYANIITTDNKAVYYAGFGWKKSGHFNNKKEWEYYLNEFSEKLKNPLVVKIIQ